MRISSGNHRADSFRIRAMATGGFLLLAACSISSAAAGGLDIFYAQGRANPTQQYPGLDIFSGWSSAASTPAVPAQPAAQIPGEWPGLDIYRRPPTITAVNTYDQTCRQGTWQFTDGAQVSGVACLQPDGSWRFVH